MNERTTSPEEIASVSPEGAPANPWLGTKSMIALLLMFPSAVILISIVFWVMLGPVAAVIAFAIGLVVCIIANPTLWAMLQRAKDRRLASGRE